MSYFEVVGLTKEPFSTSPDPSFFYLSREHKAALFRLQIAIQLKRGLAVVMGDVGTGKTTLSRKLAQQLHGHPDVLFHMILNPYFKTPRQFLYHLARLFHLDIADRRATACELIEAVERFLFQKGVDENRTVVLLIDEAQLVPNNVLETLRILLNYETNEFKILQLILVGQLELLERLKGIRNFWDRIAMRYLLNPLDKEELARAVQFRLTQAGCHDINRLFTPEALEIIYQQSQGYPRRFTLMCHNALEGLVMHDRQLVDADLVRTVAHSDAIA